MFGYPDVTLDIALYDRAVERARQLGLPSLDAYLAELVKRDLQTVDEQQQRDQVLERLKGFGYLQ